MKYPVQDISAAGRPISWILMQGYTSQHTRCFSRSYRCHGVPIVAPECLGAILPLTGMVGGWVPHREPRSERRENQRRRAEGPMDIDRKLLFGCKRPFRHAR